MCPVFEKRRKTKGRLRFAYSLLYIVSVPFRTVSAYQFGYESGEKQHGPYYKTAQRNIKQRLIGYGPEFEVVSLSV
jgi:hypothetical protein